MAISSQWSGGGDLFNHRGNEHYKWTGISRDTAEWRVLRGGGFGLCGLGLLFWPELLAVNFSGTVVSGLGDELWCHLHAADRNWELAGYESKTRN